MVCFTAADSNSPSVAVNETPRGVVGVTLNRNDYIALDMVNNPTMADATIAILQEDQVIWLWSVVTAF